LKMEILEPRSILTVYEICRFKYRNKLKYFMKCEPHSDKFYVANIDLCDRFDKMNWTGVSMPLKIICGNFHFVRSANKKQIQIVAITSGDE